MSFVRSQDKSENPHCPDCVFPFSSSCSNHHHFKECLILKSDSCCPDCREAVPANYARMFLDKALGFVTKECNRAG